MSGLKRLGSSLLAVGIGVLIVVSGCTQETEETQETFPPEDRILATDTTGGWVNVDFLAVKDPYVEAQRCVLRRPDVKAVACFAFGSRASYRASEPTSAGNFTNPCWDARWSRNKLGSESGGESTHKPTVCPDREQVDDDVSPSEKEAETAPEIREIEQLRVKIQVTHRRSDDGRLQVYGETNLPDGTTLSLSLKREGYMAQSEAQVRDGQYESEWFSSGGRGLAPGQYEISVTVPFHNAQPAGVREVLGEKLQKMTGPLVEWMEPQSMGKVAHAGRTVTIR